MKIKRPNGFLYYVAFVLIYPVLKLLFHFKVDRKNYRPPKGPFIVICNHVSFMDFLLSTVSMFPYRLNAVAAQKFFFYRPLDKLLPMMGCIPKNLFDPDIRAVMGIMSVLKRGDKILLFPEGRCTVAGDYMGIHKAAGKLVKKLGVPVISCRITGSYICMPFWRKGVRLGKVRVKLSNLFSAEDTKTLSVDEINRAIDVYLSGEDVLLSGEDTCLHGKSTLFGSEDAPPCKPLYTFGKRRLAEGLENILYYCIKCGKEFTLETKGNTIRCTSCGNTISIDRYAHLSPALGSIAPETIQSWYREQSRYEMRQLHEDMEPLVFKVTVRMPITPGEGVTPCGEGMLSLSPKGWQYEGQLLGEPASIFFPIEMVPALPFDPNDDFQIYKNGRFYMFTPDDARACSKYATIGECAYWRFVSDIQMTPGLNSGFCE